MADIKAGQRVRLWRDSDNKDIGFVNSEPFFITITDTSNELDLVVINSAYGETPVVMPLAGKYEASPTTTVSKSVTETTVVSAAPLFIAPLSDCRLKLNWVSSSGFGIPEILTKKGSPSIPPCQLSEIVSFSGAVLSPSTISRVGASRLALS